MKIVGTISTDCFLAEVTVEELDYLAGKKLGTEGNYRSGRIIKTGTSFNIVPIFAQIHRNGQRKREIDSLRATLNAMLVGLDMIEPLIEEPQPVQQDSAVTSVAVE